MTCGVNNNGDNIAQHGTSGATAGGSTTTCEGPILGSTTPRRNAIQMILLVNWLLRARGKEIGIKSFVTQKQNVKLGGGPNLHLIPRP